MIQIVWTRPAEEDLRSIFDFLTEKRSFSDDFALEIIGAILDKPEMLKNGLTAVGQREPLLKNLPTIYRYLISENYKIIYSVRQESVYIHMVFDTSQNPRKLSGRFEDE